VGSGEYELHEDLTMTLIQKLGFNSYSEYWLKVNHNRRGGFGSP